MNEKLTICPKCGGDACHEASNEKLTVWSALDVDLHLIQL